MITIKKYQIFRREYMKRKVLVALVAVSVVFFMVGCLTTPTPKGIIYTGCKGPVYGTANASGSKMGTSKAQSLLGLVAWGDASVNAAAKGAGIKKIQHVDYKEFSLLGIYVSYETQVYGE